MPDETDEVLDSAVLIGLEIVLEADEDELEGDDDEADELEDEDELEDDAEPTFTPASEGGT